MNYRVVLGDDEPEVLRSIQRTLDWEKYGFSVVGAFLNGLDVLEFLENHDVDIVFTDIRMPFMDGIELMHKIKEKYPYIKLVIISGYDDFQYAKEALIHGVLDYILKPINAREMSEVLQKVKDKMDTELEEKQSIQKLRNLYLENQPIIRENFLNRLVVGNIKAKALQEEKIAQIAEQVRVRSDVRFVLIAGPSSSSKTTFSHRLSVQLRANGLCPYPIAVDNYFKEREETPKDENGNYDFEGLGAVDVDLFNRQLQELLDGIEVVIPEFNFVTGHKEYKGRPKKLKENEVLVIEGIHCLNPELTRNLPDENKFKIYISALTQLNIDEHNRIPTTDGRLIRRIVRDARTRGTSAKETIRMWPSVRKGEECNIFPYQEEADVMFNSALIYELAVLKPYVEAQLFGIERECPEYLEAKRLLKFLDYFVGIGSENVPANSLLREFIGGGCFHV